MPIRGVTLKRLNLQARDAERFIELLDGLLLGDGSIEKCGSINVGQSVKRAGWLRQIKRQLDAFGCETRLTAVGKGSTHVIRGAAVQTGETMRLRTRVYEELKRQRRRWYPFGVKRVPTDVRVTAISIAHWFAGDGVGGRSGELMFCTNGFARPDVERLVRALPVVASLRSIRSRPGQYIIAINRRNEAMTMAKMIRRLMPTCCRYKLRFVRPTRGRREAMPEATVREVRRLYATRKWTQQMIADKFTITQSDVSDVVRRVTFKNVA